LSLFGNEYTDILMYQQIVRFVILVAIKCRIRIFVDETLSSKESNEEIFI
jgi:hypothetical protein